MVPAQEERHVGHVGALDYIILTDTVLTQLFVGRLGVLGDAREMRR
jgi:hypothetical protein